MTESNHGHADPSSRRAKPGFLRREEGAVTVDWIVLTGSIVFLGLAALFYVGSSVPELANSLKSYLEGVDVGG